MPPIDTVRNTNLRPPRGKRKPVYGPPAPKPKPKVVYGPPAPKPKPFVLHHPTPDQADRNRSPRQKRRDRAASERNIREASRKVVARRTAPSRQLDTEGTRARGPS